MQDRIGGNMYNNIVFIVHIGTRIRRDRWNFVYFIHITYEFHTHDCEGDYFN